MKKTLMSLALTALALGASAQVVQVGSVEQIAIPGDLSVNIRQIPAWPWAELPRT